MEVYISLPYSTYSCSRFGSILILAVQTRHNPHFLFPEFSVGCYGLGEYMGGCYGYGRCCGIGNWRRLCPWILVEDTALSRFYDIRRRLTASATMLLVFGVLFIAIRGGVTVSTMNPSSAYFSTNSRMNHAAVNPMFSLMYSAMHSSDFSKQFRYFDNDSDLSAAIKALNEPDESASDTTFIKLRDGVDKPDVYIIILESFSSHLMPSLGGDSVAMHYDSIAREGVLFDNFYANSFRTDRAIPSILSGYPLNRQLRL